MEDLIKLVFAAFIGGGITVVWRIVYDWLKGNKKTNNLFEPKAVDILNSLDRIKIAINKIDKEQPSKEEVMGIIRMVVEMADTLRGAKPLGHDLRDMKEDIEDIKEKVTKLDNAHDVKNDDGTPIWFFPSSITKTMDALKEKSSIQVSILKQILKSLEKNGEYLANLK